MKKPDKEENTNTRILDILKKLKENRPSQQDLIDLVEQEPPFPTYPSPGMKDKRRKMKKSPYLL
jgi:hypothetical protein